MRYPLLDQANLLTESQKQEISQRILAPHEQGKAQIGVVIVPSTGARRYFSTLPCELLKNGNWVRQNRIMVC